MLQRRREDRGLLRGGVVRWQPLELGTGLDLGTWVGEGTAAELQRLCASPTCAQVQRLFRGGAWTPGSCCICGGGCAVTEQPLHLRLQNWARATPGPPQNGGSAIGRRALRMTSNVNTDNANHTSTKPSQRSSGMCSPKTVMPMTNCSTGARYRSSPSATSGSRIAAAPKRRRDGRGYPRGHQHHRVAGEAPNVIVPVAASTRSRSARTALGIRFPRSGPGPLGLLLAYAPSRRCRN